MDVTAAILVAGGENILAAVPVSAVLAIKLLLLPLRMYIVA